MVFSRSVSNNNMRSGRSVALKYFVLKVTASKCLGLLHIWYIAAVLPLYEASAYLV
jgi:hypothetical protein